MAIEPIPLPAIELPAEDGEPLESAWHRSEINLLVESLRHHWRDRTDFYAGGNMFIYYSLEQARRRSYRGPDFFVVLDVDGTHLREARVVWEEDGRYPDVIVELLSHSTAEEDKTVKKTLYERTFRTSEYFWYDPDTQEPVGWRLGPNGYAPIEPNERGWLWSERLGLWLGRWEGEYLRETTVWLRFYDADGQVVMTFAEAAQQQAEAAQQQAEAAQQQAEAAQQRAEQAEAELARLQARLRELGRE